MPDQTSTKVACGDTPFCSGCAKDDRKPGGQHIETPTHTMNAQGYCDFYDGADKTIVFIKPRLAA